MQFSSTRLLVYIIIKNHKTNNYLGDLILRQPSNSQPLCTYRIGTQKNNHILRKRPGTGIEDRLGDFRRPTVAPGVSIGHWRSQDTSGRAADTNI